MLETRDPDAVLTILRTAERLLIEQADQLRRHAVSRPDCGNWGPIDRYRPLLETAADLGQLAAEIVAEAARSVARLKVADFLAQLDERELRTLTTAIDAGLREAGLAAQCLTEPGPQTQDVLQLLAYLTRASAALRTAQELVRRRA